MKRRSFFVVVVAVLAAPFVRKAAALPTITPAMASALSAPCLSLFTAKVPTSRPIERSDLQPWTQEERQARAALARPVDKETGIAIRFIQQWDIHPDSWSHRT